MLGQWGTRGWEEIQGSAFTQSTPRISKEVFIKSYFPKQGRECEGGSERGQDDGWAWEILLTMLLCLWEFLPEEGALL